MSGKYLETRVMTPEVMLFEGNATAVQAKNESGEFSVLPMHANFITIIQGQVEVRPVDGEPQTFSIHEGVLRVKEDVVDIFTEIAVDTKDTSTT